MALTTLDNFINIYCVEDGMLANADNVNKSPIQLKKEIDEVYTTLTSTKNSKQVLDAIDAIQINGKVLSLKKGDASVETVSFDLFDTKVDKIVSVDNRIPRFNGTSGNLKLSSITIDDNGNIIVPGSITSNTGVLTGNAASATKLQTARTIGGVSFDGTANITLPGVNAVGNQNTTGNAASATKLQTARLIGGVSFDGTANIDLPGVNIIGNQNTTGNAASATKLQTARLIGGVSFDGTANITLPGVNAIGNQNTTGNAATATKLQTARLIGGVSFDGTADITLPGVNAPGTQNAASATKLQTARLIGGVSFDGTANITLPGVNAIGNQNTTGNAATATKLQTARLIGGVSFDGTANIDLPGVNIIGNQNTTGNAASATKLQTSRLIGGVSFDGTADITLPGVNAPGTQNAASATKLQTARTITLSGVTATAQSFDGTSNITIPISSIPASLLSGKAILTGIGNDYHTGGLMLNGDGTANTIFPTLGFHQPNTFASSIQLRSAGNFSFYQQGGLVLANINAQTVNAELNGNAASATKLQTARTIGGVSFDGTANITLPGVNAIGNQNTTGNAASATKLQTARTITLSGVLSGSASFDGTSNVTLTASHTADPTITLTGGVSGSAVMYDLRNVTISTTITNDSHTHDTRYYQKNESDLRFLKLTGGSLTGSLSTTGDLTITGTTNIDGGLAQDGHVILNGTDTWLRTKNATGWYNSTYEGGMYMIDSTWVRTYNGKGLATDGGLSVGGAAYLNGDIVVGNGKVASYITMHDSDEGSRILHCNSNRIGFLKQDGNWGSYCSDDGSWASDVSITAPNHYGGRFIGTGYGNDFSSGAIETRGTGSANNVYPTIGFHQPGLYAGSIQQRSAAEFYFYQQGAGAYANVTAGIFRGTATSANYADLAEKYLTDEEYPIGTVLEIGGSKEATLFNDGVLAGVVSENPGFRLNEESIGQFIALKGKIPVKCNSEIKKGQYCVAIKGGVVQGKDKKDLTFQDSLNLVGVALEDSKDNLVMTKV